MSESIGPHLLGAKRSPEDARDYKLAAFNGIGVGETPESAIDLIDLAAAELSKTTVTFKRWAATEYVHPEAAHWWRAFDYLSRAKVAIGGVAPPPPTSDRTWAVGAVLDQMETGHCVGFGWANWSNTAPVLNAYVNADGHAIYYESKVIEGHPGDEDGAYPRDGAKAMKNRSRLSVYASAASVDEALVHLRTKGPLVVGTDWLNDMFEPAADGRAYLGGEVAGGHCYLWNGVQGTKFWFEQSWGKDWGINGRFYIEEEDFRLLFDDYGEIWAAVELPL